MEEDEEEDSTIDDEEDARIRQGLPHIREGLPMILREECRYLRRGRERNYRGDFLGDSHSTRIQPSLL